MIDKRDKENLRKYAHKMCEDQDKFDIDVFFYFGAYDDELIKIMINGQTIYKDTFFEALSFLEGMKFCFPYLAD